MGTDQLASDDTDDAVVHPLGSPLFDCTPVMARRQSVRDILYYFSAKPSKAIPQVSSVNIGDWPAGEISVMWVNIVADAFGSPICVPVMLAKGTSPGKVIGLTAAIHGNEVSGIPTIQKIFHDLAPHICNLKGAVLAIPCCNQFGFENATRFYQVRNSTFVESCQVQNRLSGWIGFESVLWKCI